jgi:hypothetical protein
MKAVEENKLVKFNSFQLGLNSHNYTSDEALMLQHEMDRQLDNRIFV